MGEFVKYNYGSGVAMECLADNLKSFYKNLENVNLENISIERIEELKSIAKRIGNGKFNNLIIKYTRMINFLITSSKNIGITSEDEKYIVFMFAVDQNFDMLSTYFAERNITNNLKPEVQRKRIKEKMWKRFGLYDTSLIKFESKFIHSMKEKRIQEEQFKQSKKR